MTREPHRATTDAAPMPGDADWETWLKSRTVSSEGVDIALIREHLSRTPTERLAILERTVNDLLELRGGRWPEVP